MAFIWIILIGKVLLCVAAAAPTLFFLRGGGWLKDKFQRRLQRRLERALTKLSPDFHPDESYFSRGVGLAADFQDRRFFIAEHDGGRTRAAVLSFSALRNVVSGEMSLNGFYDIYVDLEVDDSERPSWRLLLGENKELEHAVKQTLSAITGR